MAGSILSSDNFTDKHQDEWRALVDLDSLRDASKQSDDGIALGPIDLAYRGETTPVQPRGGAWTIIQPIEHPDRRQAEAAIDGELAGGAGGLTFVLRESASARRSGFGLSGSLAGLAETLSRHDDLHLRLEGGFESYAAADSFLGRRAASTTFAVDPLAEAAVLGGFPRPLAEIEGELVTAARSLEWHDREGSAAIADGRVWSAAGASEVQELAGMLGSVRHYVRLLADAGMPPASAVARIGITLAADAHTLLTIAKLRAARLVHARFVEALDLSPVPAKIHVETAWRMMTRRTPQLNMLRTASAALAAGIGGADSITVLPFSAALGLPDEFARRLARNSQIILLEESGMARVGDPGAGSGTIERITAELAEMAWERFRAIEAKGGLLAALRSGSLQRDIAEMRDRRAAKIARREVMILGVTAFAAKEEMRTGVLAEAPSSIAMPPMVETIVALAPMRLAELYET